MRARCTSPHAVRRGLSLVEILVSVAIVLAVAAVAVPWTAGWLGGRELDQAEDQLSMQLMMARAAAREEGRPVEVVADLEGRGQRVRARFLDGLPVDDAGLSSDTGDRGSDTDDEFGEFATGDRDDDRAPSIDASWARLELPPGVRLAVGADGFRRSVRGDDGPAFSTRLDAPAAVDPLDAVDDADTDAGDDAVATAAGGTTLAIFLPDGTAIVAPVFMLRTDSGRMRAMQVDRATGRPRAVERAPSTAGSDSGTGVEADDGFDSSFDADDAPIGADPDDDFRF
jgi:prepilin-type N-terminal cleavage/methylation domain-containing protein